LVCGLRWPLKGHASAPSRTRVPARVAPRGSHAAAPPVDTARPCRSGRPLSGVYGRSQSSVASFKLKALGRMSPGSRSRTACKDSRVVGHVTSRARWPGSHSRLSDERRGRTARGGMRARRLVAALLAAHCGLVTSPDPAAPAGCAARGPGPARGLGPAWRCMSFDPPALTPACSVLPLYWHALCLSRIVAALCFLNRVYTRHCQEGNSCLSTRRRSYHALHGPSRGPTTLGRPCT
jgi:hypothetical protein